MRINSVFLKVLDRTACTKAVLVSVVGVVIEALK